MIALSPCERVPTAAVLRRDLIRWIEVLGTEIALSVSVHSLRTAFGADLVINKILRVFSDHLIAA